MIYLTGTYQINTCLFKHTIRLILQPQTNGKTIALNCHFLNCYLEDDSARNTDLFSRMGAVANQAKAKQILVKNCEIKPPEILKT